MAERPKNYGKWTDINAKIGDYLREKGYNPDRVDFESSWLGTLQREFGLGRERAKEWGFTPGELDKIDKMRDRAQAEVNSRTIFYKGGTITGPNPYATPESEVRRRCQERLANLDNIIHMWDIFAIIGGGPRKLTRFEIEALEKPSPHDRPKFDLFKSYRDSASSAAISSSESQRENAGYEAFDDTINQDKGTGKRSKSAPSDAKTSDFIRAPQSKGSGTSGTIPPLPVSVIYSPETLSTVGRQVAEKAANIGLG